MDKPNISIGRADIEKVDKSGIGISKTDVEEVNKQDTITAAKNLDTEDNS